MNESVLDNPREDLDGAVWKKSQDGIYVLTDQAKEKIDSLVSWVVGFLHLDTYEARITGSITSNQYSDNSDIDVHVYSDEIDIDDSDEVNKKVREAFEEYKQHNDTVVGSHPLEIYIQVNKYQDYMSIGCYDIVNSKWLVGPEIKSMDYDSYAEYYEDDMQNVKGVINDIRNIILECLESSIVIKKSQDEKFRQFEYEHLLQKLKQGADIFTMARNFRKVYSSPSSIEDALKKRDSKKWKVADSAFKLLDQFGYLSVLRTLKDLNEKQKDGQVGIDEITSTIISQVSDNMSKNKNLSLDETVAYGEFCNESIGKALGQIGVIASLLFVPGLMDYQALANGLKNVPKQEFNIKSDEIQKVLRAASQNKKSYDGLSTVHLVNLVATIIYNEAMIDYKRIGDERCLIAIGNVIENRSGKDPNKFAKVVMAPSQFYSSKHVIGGVKDSDYKTYYPVNGYKKAWDLSQIIAYKMIKGELKNVIGNRNMIGNKKIDNKKEWEKWGKKGDLNIGSHTFGYDKSQDGNRKARDNVQKKSTIQYVVKKGDTLDQIAKKYNTTSDQIAKKNKIKNKNVISVGQKLTI